MLRAGEDDDGPLHIETLKIARLRPGDRRTREIWGVLSNAWRASFEMRTSKKPEMHIFRYVNYMRVLRELLSLDSIDLSTELYETYAYFVLSTLAILDIEFGVSGLTTTPTSWADMDRDGYGTAATSAGPATGVLGVALASPRYANEARKFLATYDSGRGILTMLGAMEEKEETVGCCCGCCAVKNGYSQVSNSATYYKYPTSDLEVTMGGKIKCKGGGRGDFIVYS